MDSSNRQKSRMILGSGADQVDKMVSTRVLLLANLTRTDYEELTTDEWAELVRIVIAQNKPYFSYIPFFRQTKDLRYLMFGLESIPAGWGYINYRGTWQEEHFEISKSKAGCDPVMSDFLNRNRAVGVCDVPYGDKLAVKVMLNASGVISLLYCHWETSRHSVEVDNIGIVVDKGDAMERIFFLYPQIGRNIIFAISRMISDTYDQKIKDLETIRSANVTVGNICKNLLQLDASFR